MLSAVIIVSKIAVRDLMHNLSFREELYEVVRLLFVYLKTQHSQIIREGWRPVNTEEQRREGSSKPCWQKFDAPCYCIPFALPSIP